MYYGIKSPPSPGRVFQGSGPRPDADSRPGGPPAQSSSEQPTGKSWGSGNRFDVGGFLYRPKSESFDLLTNQLAPKLGPLRDAIEPSR